MLTSSPSQAEQGPAAFLPVKCPEPEEAGDDQQDGPCLPKRNAEAGEHSREEEDRDQAQHESCVHDCDPPFTTTLDSTRQNTRKNLTTVFVSFVFWAVVAGFFRSRTPFQRSQAAIRFAEGIPARFFSARPTVSNSKKDEPEHPTRRQECAQDVDVGPDHPPISWIDEARYSRKPNTMNQPETIF